MTNQGNKTISGLTSMRIARITMSNSKTPALWSGVHAHDFD